MEISSCNYLHRGLRKTTVLSTFIIQLNRFSKIAKKIKANLQGPKLDIPLEAISWTLHYPKSWNIDEWDGNLTLNNVNPNSNQNSDLNSYLHAEQRGQLLKKAKAENLLTEANQLLAEGRQEAARSAFSDAYTLSQSDDALNEDARIQLSNIRQDQALFALANRRNNFINTNSRAGVSTSKVAINKEHPLSYTDEDAKIVLSRNTQEDNAKLRRLATRLVEQQEAMPTAPQAINTHLPQIGKKVTLSRSLQIKRDTDLSIKFQGTVLNKEAHFDLKAITLLCSLILVVNLLSRKK